MRSARSQALVVLEEPLVGVHAAAIAERAAQDRLPTLFAPSRVHAGGLLAYGTSQRAAIGRMAALVDEVLRGARAGDRPVERVTRYELVVNLKTARRIGLDLPPALVARADRVIREESASAPGAAAR
jgi:putative ABC transport system substrate-binding protein